MDVYKRETQEILSRFLHHQLKFPACIAALGAALSGLIPILKPEQLPELRDVLLTNNERVMAEMHRREPKRIADAKSNAAKKRPRSKVK